MYEIEALKAKSAFLLKLKVYMKSKKIWQKDIAQTIGVTNTTVSAAMRSPENCSENFIRLVSKNMPGLEEEYRNFRNHVDADFLPAKNRQTPTKKKERRALIDGTIDEIIGILESLKRSL